MRSMRKLISIAFAASALFALPASAHPSGTAVGSFAILTDQKTPIGQAHGNALIHEVAAIQYTGGLSGATPAEAVSWGKVDPNTLPDCVVALA